MLSRAKCLKSTRLHISKRAIAFDYLKVANDVDAGKSLEHIEQERQDVKQKQASEAFTWDWITWYEKNNAEGFANYSFIKNKMQPYEQFVGDRSAQKAGRPINFSYYRDRIADPKFVDELEIAYNVEVNTMSSVKGLETLGTWDKSKYDGFKGECSETGDLLLAPIPDAERQENQEKLMSNCEEVDEKNKDVATQLFAEFEQMDVERLMFGQETFQMRLSEHPQYAENIEDLVASRQHNFDYHMWPFHHEFVKRERLAQIQDEERRKVFLERYELSSKINNGEDYHLGRSAGGH